MCCMCGLHLLYLLVWILMTVRCQMCHIKQKSLFTDTDIDKFACVGLWFVFGIYVRNGILPQYSSYFCSTYLEIRTFPFQWKDAISTVIYLILIYPDLPEARMMHFQYKNGLKCKITIGSRYNMLPRSPSLHTTAWNVYRCLYAVLWSFRHHFMHRTVCCKQNASFHWEHTVYYQSVLVYSPHIPVYRPACKSSSLLRFLVWWPLWCQWAPARRSVRSSYWAECGRPCVASPRSSSPSPTWVAQNPCPPWPHWLRGWPSCSSGWQMLSRSQTSSGSHFWCSRLFCRSSQRHTHSSHLEGWNSTGETKSLKVSLQEDVDVHLPGISSTLHIFQCEDTIHIKMPNAKPKPTKQNHLEYGLGCTSVFFLSF